MAEYQSLQDWYSVRFKSLCLNEHFINLNNILILILLLSGDIHENPGPDLDQDD